ncbi:MAG: radical SAM protein [Candidatus Glassbacteria bacterium]
MKPEAIIIEDGLRSEGLAGSILQNLDGVKVKTDPRFWLTDVKYLEGDFQSHMKKVLRLSGRKGGFIRSCPGQRGMLCCSYFVLDTILGCPADCHYCILQDVFRDLPITINVDTDAIFREIQEFLSSRSAFTRIGTGELSDSLLLEDITHFAERAVTFFSTVPGAILELKTKGARVGLLERLDGKGRTVVSMSLAPQHVIDVYESGTASLAERIESSALCASWGYPVGFHFDPILLEGDWEGAYTGIVSDLKEIIDPGNVAWVSMGAFRFTRRLVAVIRERFPGSGLLAGEFVKCSDGKYRYPFKIRTRAYRLLYEKLKSWSSQFPVYLCMESPRVWMEMTGESPPSPAGLSSMLDERAMYLANRSSSLS